MTETVKIDINKNDEINLEKACSEIGLTVDELFKAIVKKICFEKHINFDIKIDPFYSDSNISYLEKKLTDYKAGKLKLESHDLIED